MTSWTCQERWCAKRSWRGHNLQFLSRKTQTGVCVCIWLVKCPLNCFISVVIVAFKGILGHAGIFSYLKLWQPKHPQFPGGSMWSQACSICFSLILPFSYWTGRTKWDPGLRQTQCRWLSPKWSPLYCLGGEISTFTAVNLFWSSFLYLIRKALLWAPSPVLLTLLGAMPSTRAIFGSQVPVGLKDKYTFMCPWSHSVLIICWRALQSWCQNAIM